ncbi:hypothetical protein DFA_11325 [Cavenderia fasciculata]|uniref:FNIP repeat-containing protein n=1 Tax=Cavenderia fasciculata TaxID=261658 RepID=F4QCC9_CACFS|nr:uncharacterized protein DFA_11325 [Cavenderia fasciculata]EGG13564.1 hypothetical protein DFA_11325 [Cavenderia fasciculata]|eukprot:XP_004350268.1 hypothetical protein DFA_11325 [Cavenderia fasciculata]
MESIVKDCTSNNNNNNSSVCRICNQKITSSDDGGALINHYLECIDSLKSVLLNIKSSNQKHDDDQQDSTTRKRKKIENVSPTTTTISSTNHYFKDTLFRVSMISILHREDHNQSVMSLLMTCKDAMKWKDTVVFPRLPSIDTIAYYKKNRKINQLPRRYNRVYIDNDRDRDYFQENVDGLINHHCRELYYNVDEELPAGFIPDHFTKIYFGEDYQNQLEVGSIPPFTTHLYLGDSYQQDIHKQLFPDTLEVLNIPTNVTIESGDINDLLPHNIKELHIPSDLVHPYLFKLKQLTCLIIADIESEDGENDGSEGFVPTIKVGSLPNTIVHLDLESCSVEVGAIPSSVKYLSINLTNNDPTCIPSSVKSLYAKWDESTPITKGMIPSTVTELVLDEQYSLLPGSIPSSVTTLTLMALDETPPKGAIPNKVHSLFLFGMMCELNASILPNSIKYLGIHGDCSLKLISMIPPSTKYFDYQSTNLIGADVKFSANDIPNGVTHIRLGVGFNKVVVPGFIPDSCEYLEFSETYDHRVPHWALPKSLKTISYNPACRKISENIPSSLNQSFTNIGHEGTHWETTPMDYWKGMTWHLNE